MPINIPATKSIQFIPVPDTADMLSKLMNGAAAVYRMSNVGGGGGGGRGRSASSDVKTTRMILSDGTALDVPGGTAKEREANKNAILGQYVDKLLKGSSKFGEAVAELPRSSVEKQGRIVERIDSEILPELAANQPEEIKALLGNVSAALHKQHAKNVSEVEKARNKGVGMDIAIQRGKEIAASVASLFGGGSTPEEKLAEGRARAQGMQDLYENNAYLRNQRLREQEGEGWFSRAFSGTGSAWEEAKALGAQFLPEMAADVGLPLAGAAVAGPAGFVAGLGSAMAIGGAEERGQYLSNAATRNGLTEAQRLEAVSGYAPTAAGLMGGALSAVGSIPGVGRAVGTVVRQPLLRSMATGALEGAVQSGAEQIGQNALLGGASGTDISWTENLGEALVSGAIAGAPLGGVSHAAQRRRPSSTDDSGMQFKIEELPDNPVPPSPSTQSKYKMPHGKERVDFWTDIRDTFYNNPDDVTYETVRQEYANAGYDVRSFDIELDAAARRKGMQGIPKKIARHIERTKPEFKIEEETPDGMTFRIEEETPAQTAPTPVEPQTAPTPVEPQTAPAPVEPQTTPAPAETARSTELIREARRVLALPENTQAQPEAAYEPIRAVRAAKLNQFIDSVHSKADRLSLDNLHTIRDWATSDSFVQKVGTLDEYRDFITTLDEYIAQKTAEETGSGPVIELGTDAVTVRGETNAQGQAETAAASGRGAASDSRVEENTAAGGTGTPDGGTASTAGDTRAVGSTGTGGTALPRVRAAESNEVAPQPQRSGNGESGGRVEAVSGQSDRVSPARGEESNQSAGVSGTAQRRSTSNGGDAEAAGNRRSGAVEWSSATYTKQRRRAEDINLDSVVDQLKGKQLANFLEGNAYRLTDDTLDKAIAKRMPRELKTRLKAERKERLTFYKQQAKTMPSVNLSEAELGLLSGLEREAIEAVNPALLGKAKSAKPEPVSNKAAFVTPKVETEEVVDLAKYIVRQRLTDLADKGDLNKLTLKTLEDLYARADTPDELRPTLRGLIESKHKIYDPVVGQSDFVPANEVKARKYEESFFKSVKTDIDYAIKRSIISKQSLDNLLARSRADKRSPSIYWSTVDRSAPIQITDSRGKSTEELGVGTFSRDNPVDDARWAAMADAENAQIAQSRDMWMDEFGGLVELDIDGLYDDPGVQRFAKTMLKGTDIKLDGVTDPDLVEDAISTASLRYTDLRVKEAFVREGVFTKMSERDKKLLNAARADLMKSTIPEVRNLAEPLKRLRPYAVRKAIDAANLYGKQHEQEFLARAYTDMVSKEPIGEYESLYRSLMNILCRV